MRLELHRDALGRVFGNPLGPHTVVEHLPYRYVLMRDILRDAEQLAELAVADDKAALGVEHAKAVRHVVERRVKLTRELAHVSRCI